MRQTQQKKMHATHEREKVLVATHRLLNTPMFEAWHHESVNSHESPKKNGGKVSWKMLDMTKIDDTVTHVR